MASKKSNLLEQHLQDELHPFAARSLTPPSGAQGTKEESKQGGLERPEDQKTERPQDLNAVRPKDPTTERPFDLNQEADIRRGFNFTQEELDAIEDLKIDLDRKIGIELNRYDVVRIGVHEIVEDYRKKGEASIIVRRAKKKAPK